ncbi:MAG: thermonuclease family protein [Myxococcota bacterium]|nr:thermonuclease family protein [Myxococcota bacterium]
MFWICACIVGDKSEGVVDTASMEDAILDSGAVSSIDAQQLPAAENPCRAPQLASVNYVVDGDTFYAQIGAYEEKIRMIGIDTPEMGYEGSSDDCYAQDSADFLRERIATDQVWLTFDQLCSDTYGRTLAYVHTGLGERGFVQRQMLQRGFAQTFPFDDTPAFHSIFAEDEKQASDGGLGGWEACGWE